MKTENALIFAIRSALLGKAEPLPDDFLTEQAMRLIKEHQIAPLVYYGAVNCGLPPALPQMQKLLEMTVRLISLSESQMLEVQRLRQAFAQNGIDYMLLKGAVLKELYPKPEMRVMSDTDVLIRLEQYEKIRGIMQKLGYTEGVVSDHELHWSKPAIHLELHKRLIPSYDRRYSEFFGEGWSRAKPMEADVHSYHMSGEDTFLFLFAHFAKHYRDGGIGIKHLTDLWLYRRSQPALDESYIRRALNKLRLDVFYENIMEVCTVWFEAAPPTEKTDFITKVIFCSGAFGTEELQHISWALRISENGDSGKKALRRWKREKVFLPYKRMCMKYPFLKKAPVLLPAMWVVRWGDALIFRRSEVRRQSRDAKQMTAESIDAYRFALGYVGLRYEREDRL